MSWPVRVLFGALLWLALGCDGDVEVQRARLIFPDPIDLSGDRDRPANRAERRHKKKRRFRPPPVYVDGQFKGILRFKELPPKMPTIFQELEDGRLVRRFGWVDYVEALGVDIDKLQGIHFHGGRNRACIIDGDEIRRLGNKLRFSFTRSNSGKARMELPAERVKMSSSVDMLRAVAIYEKKEPPHLEGRDLVMPDGTKVEGMAYAPDERHGGTRILRDGVLINAFRRRNMTNDLLVDAKDKTSPYSLGRALIKLGAKHDGVKRMQIVAKNEAIVGDYTGEELQKKLAELSFVLPQHSRGRILMPGLSDQTLAVVMLFAASEPTERAVPERSPAPKGNGSRPNQGKN